MASTRQNSNSIECSVTSCQEIECVFIPGWDQHLSHASSAHQQMTACEIQKFDNPGCFLILKVYPTFTADEADGGLGVIFTNQDGMNVQSTFINVREFQQPETDITFSTSQIEQQTIKTATQTAKNKLEAVERSMTRLNENRCTVSNIDESKIEISTHSTETKMDSDNEIKFSQQLQQAIDKYDQYTKKLNASFLLFNSNFPEEFQKIIASINAQYNLDLELVEMIDPYNETNDVINENTVAFLPQMKSVLKSIPQLMKEYGGQLLDTQSKVGALAEKDKQTIQELQRKITEEKTNTANNLAKWRHIQKFLILQLKEIAIDWLKSQLAITTNTITTFNNIFDGIAKLSPTTELKEYKLEFQPVDLQSTTIKSAQFDAIFATCSPQKKQQHCDRIKQLVNNDDTLNSAFDFKYRNFFTYTKQALQLKQNNSTLIDEFEREAASIQSNLTDVYKRAFKRCKALFTQLREVELAELHYQKKQLQYSALKKAFHHIHDKLRNKIDESKQFFIAALSQPLSEETDSALSHIQPLIEELKQFQTQLTTLQHEIISVENKNYSFDKSIIRPVLAETDLMLLKLSSLSDTKVEAWINKSKETRKEGFQLYISAIKNLDKIKQTSDSGKYIDDANTAINEIYTLTILLDKLGGEIPDNEEYNEIKQFNSTSLSELSVYHDSLSVEIIYLKIRDLLEGSINNLNIKIEKTVSSASNVTDEKSFADCKAAMAELTQEIEAAVEAYQLFIKPLKQEGRALIEAIKLSTSNFKTTPAVVHQRYQKISQALPNLYNDIKLDAMKESAQSALIAAQTNLKVYLHKQKYISILNLANQFLLADADVSFLQSKIKPILSLRDPNGNNHQALYQRDLIPCIDKALQHYSSSGSQQQFKSQDLVYLLNGIKSLEFVLEKDALTIKELTRDQLIQRGRDFVISQNSLNKTTGSAVRPR